MEVEDDASGSSCHSNPGGFRGGITGENCYYKSSLQKKQGAENQSGSTNGLGDGSQGVYGMFESGDTAKYSHNWDTGGGSGWL